jgi:hypothetical protein
MIMRFLMFEDCISSENCCQGFMWDRGSAEHDGYGVSREQAQKKTEKESYRRELKDRRETQRGTSKD